MGHIELAAPVSHIWYFKGIPSRMGLLLDISPRILEKVLYFASYIVLNPGETSLEYKQVLSEKEYQDAREEFGNKFRAGMGAEAVKELLMDIDLEKEYKELKEEVDSSSGQKRARVIKRLDAVEAFRESGNLPSWMIISIAEAICFRTARSGISSPRSVMVSMRDSMSAGELACPVLMPLWPVLRLCNMSMLAASRTSPTTILEGRIRSEVLIKSRMEMAWFPSALALRISRRTRFGIPESCSSAESSMVTTRSSGGI
jgi:hypothetical protein